MSAADFYPLLSKGSIADYEIDRDKRKSSYAEREQERFHKGEIVFNEASSLSSYINLTNTIVGSGMLGLPYAFANTGWVLGSILISLSGLASIFSLHILSICASKVPRPASFYSVTEATVPQLSFLIDTAVFLQCFGVSCSYLIVFGGLMPDVMRQIGADDAYQQRQIWVLIGFAIVAPLSCLRKLDALKYTSGLAIIFVVFLTFLILLFAANVPGLDPCADADDDQCGGEQELFTINMNTFRVFSIFVFAFACQTNIFAVVNELRAPSQRRFDVIIAGAILTAGGIYATVAAGGYATYGSDVESNVLLNYPRLTITSVARVFVSALVAFSYPLQCHPGRSSVMALLQMMDKNDAITDKYENMRYVVVTAAFLGCSLLIALVVTDLGIILALVGATGATIVAYILPGAAYYQMHRNHGAGWKRVGALCLLGAGLIIMPVCLVFIFL